MLPRLFCSRRGQLTSHRLQCQRDLDDRLSTVIEAQYLRKHFPYPTLRASEDSQQYRHLHDESIELSENSPANGEG